ncbi:MAG: hypothetical protein IPP29_18190 [Bacteroidetes bacterium]|nr:hypothetical protein [Bacteroidota bacterium]
MDLNVPCLAGCADNIVSCFRWRCAWSALSIPHESCDACLGEICTNYGFSQNDQATLKITRKFPISSDNVIDDDYTCFNDVNGMFYEYEIENTGNCQIEEMVIILDQNKTGAPLTKQALSIISKSTCTNNLNAGAGCQILNSFLPLFWVI